MEDPVGLVNPDGYYEYMIIKGDCLWFISDEFYKDPFNWTEIYKANSYIVDPDWIYPNNWLVIPNVYTDTDGNPIYSTSVSSTRNSANEQLKNTTNSGDVADMDFVTGSTIVDLNDSMGGDVQDSNISTNVAISPTTNSLKDSAKDDSMKGKSKADNKTKTSMDSTATMSTQKDKEVDTDGSFTGSYCGKPGWKLGITAGYPLGAAQEDQTANVGLLIGTPLGVKVGPLGVELGAGLFSYDFDKFYFGGGLLASLCINDLLNLDIPVIFQLHGFGFYIFGEDQGLGFGGIGSVSIPLGNSPVNIGLYGGLGKYYPNDNGYIWDNVGAVLFYTI
ncbi:LysM peptidoglycan-binding domain-containing protein, partial [Candidatus Neomarinimicrobiota bacterium]